MLLPRKLVIRKLYFNNYNFIRLTFDNFLFVFNNIPYQTIYLNQIIFEKHGFHEINVNYTKKIAFSKVGQ